MYTGFSVNRYIYTGFFRYRYKYRVLQVKIYLQGFPGIEQSSPGINIYIHRVL